MKTKKIEKKFRSLQRRQSATCVKMAIFHGILGINEENWCSSRVFSFDERYFQCNGLRGKLNFIFRCKKPSATVPEVVVMPKFRPPAWPFEQNSRDFWHNWSLLVHDGGELSWNKRVKTSQGIPFSLSSLSLVSVWGKREACFGFLPLLSSCQRSHSVLPGLPS